METVENALYLVATPIGNMGDITLRALDILKHCDLIAAEDTRHSGVLLRHYDIDTPQISYHAHNQAKRRQELLARLEAGQAVAVISDAGMPGISDPGEDLVRAAVDAGIKVVPIPGANALLPALVASGLPCRGFAFEGFLPRPKKERSRRLQALAKEERTMVLYISPHRLKEDLTDLLAALGDRPAVLAREMTKLYETFHRHSLAALSQLAQEREFKGEMCLVIAGNTAEAEEIPEEEALRAALARLMSQGLHPKEAARTVAEQYGLGKNDVYPLTFTILEEKKES